MRKIKVVKKKQKQVETESSEKQPTTVNARKMVDNVKDWVSDFKAKKQDETQQAIRSLFPKSPQNAES